MRPRITIECARGYPYRVSFRTLEQRQQYNVIPGNTRGHSSTEAHSMQCSGSLGVVAIVHTGYTVLCASISNEHS